MGLLQYANRVEAALQTSLEAGEILMDLQANLQIQQKADGTPVTNADLAINQLFIDVLGDAFTTDVILGEEQQHVPNNPGSVRWVIDPIDGTTDYIRGGNYNGVACAFMDNNELIFGSFYNPSRDEMFFAVKGLGAFLNGERISVSPVLAEGRVNYDYCYWPSAVVDARVFEQTHGEPLGQYSISNQACRVAVGDSLFTVFPGKQPHDILPGAIIVEEAGGKITDVYGMPLAIGDTIMRGAVYSNGPSHTDIVAQLNSH